MKEKTDNIDILEELIRDYKDEKEFVGEEIIKAMETIIAENKELKEEIEELKKDKLELINKNHVVHLKDVEKELREMRKAIDTKNAEIECLNVIHESYKEMIEENNYISKDKIKAKVIEIKNRQVKDEFITASQGKLDTIIDIESLLQEE